MLVLTRKPDQRLLIGGDIMVTVLGVRGNQVKLGITAPEDCQILREEVYLRGQKEGEKYIKAGGTD